MKLLSVGSMFFSGYLFLLLSNPVAFFSENSTYQATIDNKAISGVQIKQVSFDDTKHKNEFGYNTGWIELVNNSDNTICLQADRWSISNDSKNPGLYMIRKDITIAPYEHIIVWCDKLNAVQNNLHTNFKLHPDNGQVGLYHINSEHDLQKVDGLNYNEANKVFAVVNVN